MVWRLRRRTISLPLTKGWTRTRRNGRLERNCRELRGPRMQAGLTASPSPLAYTTMRGCCARLPRTCARAKAARPTWRRAPPCASWLWEWSRGGRPASAAPIRPSTRPSPCCAHWRETEWPRPWKACHISSASMRRRAPTENGPLPPLRRTGGPRRRSGERASKSARRCDSRRSSVAGRCCPARCAPASARTPPATGQTSALTSTAS
mmetsp:Transcript_71293/g.206765  ORF Transcript_71293/g.206765 Transcript_71293/m.206765 type:complete len:207 (-) Transcript_71293:313-933(-)